MDNNFNNQPGQQYPNGQPNVQQNQGGMPNQTMQQQDIQQPMQFTAEPPKKNNKGLIAGIIGGVAVIAIIGIVVLNNKGNGGIDDVSKLMSGNTTEYNTISTTTEVYETTEVYVDDTSAQEEVIRNIISAANKGDKAELEKYVSDDNPEKTRASMIRTLETEFTPEDSVGNEEAHLIVRESGNSEREYYRVTFYYEYQDTTYKYDKDGNKIEIPYAVPFGRTMDYEFYLDKTSDGWVLWDYEYISGSYKDGYIGKYVPDINNDSDTDEDIEAQKKVIEEFYSAINRRDKETLTKVLSKDIYDNELEYRANNIVNNYEEDHCKVEIDRCVKADESYNGLIYENVKSADDIVNCRVYKVDVYKQYDDGKSEESTLFFILIKEGTLWKVMTVEE